jgi:uncharacterized protein
VFKAIPKYFDRHHSQFGVLKLNNFIVTLHVQEGLFTLSHYYSYNIHFANSIVESRANVWYNTQYNLIGVISLTNNILEKAQDFLINKINPSFIIVFGSFANGTTHKESDIDLAFFKKEQNLSSYEVFMLAQELADILKMDVDLVDLNHASTVFQAQIFSTGKVIFSNDENLRMNIEMTALSMYAKLNEERKSILENVDESGTIL